MNRYSRVRMIYLASIITILSLFCFPALAIANSFDAECMSNSPYQFSPEGTMIPNQYFAISEQDPCAQFAPHSFDLRNDAMPPPRNTTRNHDLSTGDDNPYVYPNLNIDR